jgi:hypothetical protein
MTILTMSFLNFISNEKFFIYSEILIFGIPCIKSSAECILTLAILVIVAKIDVYLNTFKISLNFYLLISKIHILFND